MRFDARREIMDKKDLKKLQVKNLHLFIYEKVPAVPIEGKKVSDKNNSVILKPVLDC